VPLEFLGDVRRGVERDLWDPSACAIVPRSKRQ
jgi:hypothetical protein